MKCEKNVLSESEISDITYIRTVGTTGIAW